MSKRLLRRPLAWAVSVLLGVLLLILLLGILLGPPYGGLSQAAAEKIAMANTYSTTPAHVTIARPGHFSEFANGSQAVAPDRWVWAISFSGTFPPASCGPKPIQPGLTAKCPAPQHSELVLIDYFNGDFISASVPSPIQ
jgi:hypothetical protein